MGVDVAQREYLDFSERLVADVTYNMVGYAVVDGVHEPLDKRCYTDDDTGFDEYSRDSREINLPLADDKVDRVANKDRRVEGQSHRDGSEQYRQHHEEPVALNVFQHLFKSAFLRGIFLASGCVWLCHLYRLLLELGIVDLAVDGAAVKQLVVLAYAGYLAIVEDDYFICVLY